MEGSPLQVVSQLGDQADAAIRVLLPGVQVRAVPPGYDAPEILDADILLHYPDVRSGQAPPLTRPDGWPGRLRLIQLISTGTDFYPDWLFAGPPVTSASGLAGPPIAEYCLAVIFAAARHMPGVWMKSPEDWNRSLCDSVRGSRVGIYGFGSIGQSLARSALALGMEVAAVRRSSAPLGMDGVEQFHDLAGLIATCDHLVLAAPGTPETRHVVNAQTLAAAKPGLHLINVARGNLVDNNALLAALDNGTVARATLDVTEPEPLPAGHPFYANPRVFLSPHIANTGHAFLDALNRRAADNIGRVSRNEPLVGLVTRS